ncbi:MAG: hypothetical protein HZB61_08765 [Nitrospirae bacterium]|nr:hypothetical protein [Nitrospirota bacterium]
MEKALKLNEAFYSFTQASKSLEAYYTKLSEQVRYLTQELERKNARVSELERLQERNSRLIAMGEMAAKIVHEIRSPLCSVELFASMLSNDLKGTRHEEMSKGISSGIHSLNNILTNMLMFARDQKPSFRDVKLSGVVEDSMTMLKPLMEIRGVRVSTKLTDKVIDGDSELLKQVFMNIILNAAQAMPDGGRLEIVMDAADGFTTVSVIDEGEGISRENIEKIFDPFFSTKDKGTGLGLTIAYKIVQRHNGFIKAFINENKGCTFRLYFPENKNNHSVSPLAKGRIKEECITGAAK